MSGTICDRIPLAEMTLTQSLTLTRITLTYSLKIRDTSNVWCHAAYIRFERGN